MNSFAKGVLLGVLLALALFVGASLIHKKEKVAVTAPAADGVSEGDYLSVKGENTLLKKMLGQVDAHIVLLGPVAKKSSVQGKLVWDKTMQQGFIHITGLEASSAYQLILKTKGGLEIVAAEESGQLFWQGQFKSPQRVLDLASVEIRSKSSTPETETVIYARGLVPED